MADEKEIVWVGNSRRNIQEFPQEVRVAFGAALFWAQKGSKHPKSKPLKGFKGAGVVEILEDFDKDTYRCIYTIKFGNKVYVLHAFQKKAKKGISTPKPDIDLINERIKEVKKREGVQS